MKQFEPLLSISIFLFASALTMFSQENKASLLADNVALEVMSAKGNPLVYQRIGGWTWYDGFRRLPGSGQQSGTRSVGAVKIYTREESGTIKVKVTLLRGANFEFEHYLSEFSVGTDKVTINELAKVGVEPFEVGLVRAPVTTAYIPKVNNGTKSLVVSVEPVVSTLPSYKIRVLNSSSKPVAGFSYNTFLEGRRRYTGMPQQFDGTPLISPGDSYEKVFPYALRTTTQSTGEVPQPIEGLQLNVLAVIFADGTYEGDRIDAARFRGYKIGEKIQLTRVLGLLHSKAAASWDTLAPMADALTYRVTVSDIDPLLKDFPGLPEAEVENIRSVNGAIGKCQKWVDSLP